MAIAKRSDKEGGVSTPSLVRKLPGLQTSAKSKTLHKFIPTPEVTTAIAAIRKQYGNIIHSGDDNTIKYGEKLRTGIFILDLALAGGFKLGHSAMLYGAYSSGKTTIAAMTVARLQKLYPDKIAVWVDLEGQMDKRWMATLGVDLTRFHIVDPCGGEDALNTSYALLMTEGVAGLVIDSMAALIPVKEMENSVADSAMGQQQILIGRFLRKLQCGLQDLRMQNRYPLVIYLNQVRSKIGNVWGNPESIPGGEALKFFTSIMIKLYGKKHVVEKGDLAGMVDYNEHSFSMSKERTGGGHLQQGEYKMIRDRSLGYPIGYIDQSKTILTWAAKVGLYTGAGANQHVDGCGTFRNQEAIAKFFFENPEKQEALTNKIITHYRKEWNLE